MKKIILLLLFLMSVFFAYPALALDCGFQPPTPASSSGTMITNLSTLNTTYNMGSATEGLVTMAFFASSPSTRNSTTSLLANISNITSMASQSINLTFGNNIILEDSNDYTLSCTCYNSSAAVACNSTRTSVIFDRTAPAAATSLTYNSLMVDADTITATINLGLANRCYVLFSTTGSGGTRYSMTRSGSTCTYTASRGTNSPPNGDYQFRIVTSDNINETSTTTAFVTIKPDQTGDGSYLSNGVLKAASNARQTQSIIGSSSNSNIPFASNKGDIDKSKLGILLIFVGIVVWVLKRKK